MSESEKPVVDSGPLVTAIDKEIARLGASPAGSKEFLSLLAELEKLEKFCRAEAEGARVVERAAGLIETASTTKIAQLTDTAELAHLTGVTFASAAHLASGWEVAAEDARKLRERLQQLKLADRKSQIDIAKQLREFTTRFFEATAKKFAELPGPSSKTGKKP